MGEDLDGVDDRLSVEDLLLTNERREVAWKLGNPRFIFVLPLLSISSCLKTITCLLPSLSNHLQSNTDESTQSTQSIPLSSSQKKVAKVVLVDSIIIAPPKPLTIIICNVLLWSIGYISSDSIIKHMSVNRSYKARINRRDQIEHIDLEEVSDML